MTCLRSRIQLLLSFTGLLAVHAGNLRPLGIEEMAAQADWVVHGTVAARTVQRDAEGRIYTRVQLQPREVWKGAPAAGTLFIVHGGGRLGDTEARASVQVNYEIGEEVVALLRKNARGEGVTLGLIQGKFTVQTDPADGEQVVANPFHGRPLPAGRGVVAPSGLPERLTLSEMKRRVTGGKL